jgi:uncharacterized membrane protein
MAVMSIAQSLTGARGNGTRWLLLGSLALNLFFIGVALALAIREPSSKSRWDPNVFVRVERMAATLPADDGEILRAAMRAHHDTIEKAQKQYRDSRDAIRETLRQESFKIDDMNAAMAQTRAARQSYDQELAVAVSEAVMKMSAEGRRMLADYRGSRRSRTKPQE